MQYFLYQAPSLRTILTENYNEQRLKNAENLLNSITQKSGLLEELKKKLDNYKLCTDGLKTTMGKIIELDRKFVANNDYTQATKLQDILSELSSYFRNYRFNFTDYPYLSYIVLEIMKLKQKDANTDINNLLSKL